MKQQEQIRLFLIQQLGQEQGTIVAKKQNTIYDHILSNTTGKTANQMKTLEGTILPRVALYQVLRDSNAYSKNALPMIRNYMCNVIGKQKHASMARMEKIPGIFTIFRHVFIKIMKKTDLQKSRVQDNKDSFTIDITECLWHRACVENGCPELCPYFCEVDDITYGNLKKFGFTRSKTLGLGNDCCDFKFFKK